MNRNELRPANRDSRRLSVSALRWGVVILALGYLWFRLINNLWPEWTTNPQYGYGLLVPFLCLGLLIRRWHAVRTTGPLTTGPQDYGTMGTQDRRSVVSSPWSVVRGQWSVVLLFGILAFLYLPTRLIE